MSTGYEAYPPGLLRAAGELARLAQDLDDAWRAFQSRTEGRGDIFGDDLVGGLIGASYLAATDIADERIVSAADDLDSFAEGLGIMADTYGRTEDDTEVSFDGIAEQL